MLENALTPYGVVPDASLPPAGATNVTPFPARRTAVPPDLAVEDAELIRASDAVAADLVRAVHVRMAVRGADLSEAEKAQADEVTQRAISTLFATMLHLIERRLLHVARQRDAAAPQHHP